MVVMGDGAASGPVVVGVDGSAASDMALAWAAETAWLRALPLKIVFVAELAGYGRAVVAAAQNEVSARRPQLETITAVVHDHNAAHALIAESAQATMVVVGSRGHGGFHDLLLGSTSLQTAMHARCPVAVIRPHSTPQASGVGSRGRVVLGVEGSAHDAPALRLAFEEAHARGIGLTAVHAFGLPRGEGSLALDELIDEHGISGLEDDARTMLAQVVGPWCDQYPDVDVSDVVVHRPPAHTLIEQSSGAELVVVGSRGRGGFTGLLLGSVSQTVLHHARCPVLVAHDRPAANHRR